MTIEKRDELLRLLDAVMDQPKDTPEQLASALCQIWVDKLWEVTDDSFEDFLEREFQMTEADALLAMKLGGSFPEDVAERIDREIEKL